MMKYFLLILLGLLPFSSSSWAEEDEEINTIVITGSRTGLDLIQPTSRYVLTESEIEKSTASDLTQLLGQIPSVSIEQQGSRGSLSAVRIRGTESDHALVLVNGVRFASASSGATALQFIPINQISRIEVIKGPRSGIYGSEAIGGVIQIFTKKGEGSKNAYVETGIGSHNTQSISSGFNDSNKNSYYSVSVGYLDSDGIDSTKNNSGADRDRDAFDEKNISLNLGKVADNQSKIDFTYFSNEGTNEFDNTTEGAKTNFKIESFNLGGDFPLSKSINFNFGVNRFTDDQKTLGGYPSVFKTKRLGATTFLNFDLGKNQSLIAGLNFYDDSVDGTGDFSQSERANKAGFIEYGLANSFFNVQLALRQDDTEKAKKNTSGSFNLSIPAGIHTLLFSYGEAFKLPTFNDLYFSDGYYTGNPELEPEEAESIEVGYINDNGLVDFSISVYKTKIKNLIETNQAFTTVENISRAELIGVESSAYTVVEDWGIGLIYSYVDTENEDTGERLTRRPASSARLDIDRAFGEIDLLLSWKYESDRKQSNKTKTGSFDLIDIKGIYTANKHSKIKLTVKNIFDEDYTLVQGFQTYRTEGRTAEIAYRYTF
ncbi:MAG: vitamin B12 transporter [Cellvibrionaceae bacterium]|jgi:vitamin B12 transporter